MLTSELCGVFKHIVKNEIESYGWKWEHEPYASWDSYSANYLEYNNYSVKLWPFYLLYSGWINVGSLDRAGANGDYWSSTAYDTINAYDLHLNSASLYPSNNTNGDNRLRGFSIRCLAR